MKTTNCLLGREAVYSGRYLYFGKTFRLHFQSRGTSEAWKKMQGCRKRVVGNRGPEGTNGREEIIKNMRRSKGSFRRA
jgi:hypothetical protein